MPGVRWRTDRATAAEKTVCMNIPARIPFALPRTLLSAGLTAFALLAAFPPWDIAHAQSAIVAPATLDGAAQLHLKALEMERRKDYMGAYETFIAAAAAGYPLSQRRLGEIYDHGSPAVARNYEQSIRWYQMADDGGAYISWAGSRMPGLNYGP